MRPGSRRKPDFLIIKKEWRLWPQRSHPAILDLDECLMSRSQLRSLNRILYAVRKW
jgi:hypothetical protein